MINKIYISSLLSGSGKDDLDQSGGMKSVESRVAERIERSPIWNLTDESIPFKAFNSLINSKDYASCLLGEYICIFFKPWIITSKTVPTRIVPTLHKNQHTQRKFFNFENSCCCELSKIRHHLSNKVS